MRMPTRTGSSKVCCTGWVILYYSAVRNCSHVMKTRTVLIATVAVITLGSGLINLFSVASVNLSAHARLLEIGCPLEFMHLSRFLTLLIGFLLIVSSINIYKRKKKAYQLVLFVSCLSVVFHLTKGLDYREAFFSLSLVLVLFFTRNSFTVKSSVPNLHLGIIRFAITMAVMFAYGVVGFWLLDKREFGVDFTVADAIGKTIRFLTLQGDPAILPRTRHARWFLESLSLITAVSCCYGFFALFRPVRYRYLTLPQEREQARMITEKYGRHSLNYFKLWPDKSYFFSPSRNAFLAYRVGADFAVVLGDPVGPENEIEGIIRDFMNICHENDWGLAFHQTLPDFLGCYERLGFKKLKIGDDAIVDLTDFSLEGRENKALRHEVNKLEKSGIRTVYNAPPLPWDIVQQAQAVSDDWLKIEGRRERRFTLGLFDPEYVRSTPLCAVVDAQGKMQAFANIIRSYRPGESTIDLMRRRSDAPKGVMDYLFVKLFLQCKEKGYAEFSLGMAPMAGFQEHENPSREERAIHYFFQHMNFLFSYRGLRFYKAKFASRWEPRYVIYQNALELARHAIAIGVVSRL